LMASAKDKSGDVHPRKLAGDCSQSISMSRPPDLL
jgi:hypothetical protein